jgi:hypothetical protein
MDKLIRQFFGGHHIQHLVGILLAVNIHVQPIYQTKHHLSMDLPSMYIHRTKHIWDRSVRAVGQNRDRLEQR